MIIDTLNTKIVEAMKAKDSVRVSTLKLLSAAIHNYQIDHKDMTQEEEMEVVKKQAKQRKDSIELFKKGGFEDKAKEEEGELKILQEFLPEEIGDEELAKYVDEAIAETHATDIKQMGAVIGKVMAKAKGNADGGKVAQIVRAKLSS